MYLSKFDDDGRRTETLLLVESDENYAAKVQDALDKGYIRTSEEDWNYYIGNMGEGDNGTGYIRDSKTGRPVSAPAHVETLEEQKAALKSDYDAAVNELQQSIQIAMLNGDTEVIAELQEEYTSLQEEYLAELEALEA